MITGANSGIGLETARILGSRGAELVLACRNEEKAQAVVGTIPGHDRGRVVVRRLDVSDLSSVHAFADSFLEGHDGLDVLINNAGVMGLPFGLSPDGVELHLATNHLGHFALTNLLLPRIRDRVVVVGSRAHFSGAIDVDDLAWEQRRYRAFAAYSQSKLANLLFLAELDRRLRTVGSPVRAVGSHPGMAATHITGSSGNPVLTWIGHHGQRLVSMPPWRGALMTLYAATQDLPGNTYIGPHGRLHLRGWPSVARRSSAAEEPDLARRLWEWSERTSGVGFPLD